MIRDKWWYLCVCVCARSTGFMSKCLVTSLRLTQQMWWAQLSSFSRACWGRTLMGKMWLLHFMLEMLERTNDMQKNLPSLCSGAKNTQRRGGWGWGGRGFSSGRMKPHLRFFSLNMCSNFVVFWWVPYLQNRFWSRNRMLCVFTKHRVCGFDSLTSVRGIQTAMNNVADVNMFYWYCCCAFMHTYPAL